MSQTYHVAYESIRLYKKNPANFFEACILSQSKFISRKLLVTYDDVARPTMFIAEVIGAAVNLNG